MLPWKLDYSTDTFVRNYGAANVAPNQKEFPSPVVEDFPFADTWTFLERT
jgi:hypothetical protein